ncbi:integrator complex subunit 7-like [Pollicipes pollicipes]|uniref:integrator complex subunit 7-like n=1 Tax=Pollicipes pollicipes TaxID=41117 RepID=UPI0018854198|nr:integrator complex subunit 7-like [Pollicipes pollicipes]
MNTDHGATDADQLTANTAFVAIDKGLLSGKVNEQVEAIVKFPALFDRHPFPLLINSSMLKLADVFRIGSNFTRLCILRVCQQSERHLDKILNVDEVVRRIFSVTHSNDPVARGLALSTLGSLSAIIPQRKQVHHSIRQALDSRDPAELEAGIVAAQRFAAVSKTFATNISERISEMVQGVTTPVDIKLKLLNILQHMHHDTQTAAAVRQLCLRLLPSFPSEQFVMTTLNVLTKLAAQTLVDIPEQVDLLLGYLNNDVRRAVKSAVLRDLLELSRQAAPLWSQENQSSLIEFAAGTRYTAVKTAALSVLVCLARSVSVRQFDLAPHGPLMRLCRAGACHQEARVAGRAVQLLTALAVHCQETGTRPDVTEAAVAACDCAAGRPTSNDVYLVMWLRFGHHGVAAALLRPTLCQVSTEQMHFWLSALVELSEAEAALVAPPHDDLGTLSAAAQRYARGLSALRATTSPTQLLEFPAEFCRLRWRCLQAHIHLWTACRTLQTSPPPCLQKSGAEFSALAEEYGRLYRSSFDADPDSLACLERLQRCCLLVAQAVDWAVRRGNPETFRRQHC